MKNNIGVALCLFILLSSQFVFATEEKCFEFDDSLYSEIKITYMHGQGIPSPAGPRPNYNYTTIDVNEIELILEAINDIKCVRYHNYWGTCDGVYMYVYMNGKCELFFDVTAGKCMFGDKNFEFNKEDYIALTNVIYDLKTKNDIKMFLDDERLKPDVSPILLNDRTLVPVRAIGEALKTKVIWNNENRTVELVSNEGSITFVIDKDYIIENGYRKEIDVGSRLINHTAMVPVRALSEFFGCAVYWENNSVYISSP
ncbi:MAG: copper amine oxidase N-terminal domain-containing protein [Clostridia bacterium]|nr:copper amine oxidase N-terminal domain-containing protein [Clostridia bacterium]